MRNATVAVPGACGELVQGTLDGVPCLVSCPIDRMVEVEVVASPGLCPEGLPGDGQVTAPSTMPKTRQAVELALAELGRRDVDVTIERWRGLPESKGFASSTADIVAALYGLAWALGESISAEWATRLALQIEPTDSLAWRELVLLAHRDGRLIELLGVAPSLQVLVLDWGGAVDTLAFNRTDHRTALQRLAPIHRDVFAMLREGVASGDIGLIGRASTLSAQAHQCILYKPQLDMVLELANAVNSPGVCVAHSGTLIGVLLPTQGAADTAAYILSRLPGEPIHGLHSLVQGGPRPIQEVSPCPGV